MDRLFSPEFLPLTLTGLGLITALLVVTVGLVIRGTRRDPVAQRLNEFAGRAAAEQQTNPRQRLRRTGEELDFGVVW